MDSWGRGPWFESADDAEPEADDVDGPAGEEDDVARQPTVQQRVTGGPRPTLPPLPGSISRPLARQAGLSGIWGPDAGQASAGNAGTDTEGEPTERTRAVLGPGACGSARRPATASRPLTPGAIPNGRNENRLRDDVDAFGGFGLSAPAPATPARPLVPPILDPQSDAGLWAAMPAVATLAPVEVDAPLRAGAVPGRTPPGNGKWGKRGGDGRSRRRLMPWLVALGLVVLLLTCSVIGLLESDLLSGGSKANNSGGGSVLTQQPGATATASSTSTSTSTSGPTSTPKSKGSGGGGAPAPSPTPIPPPTAATLSFAPASQQVTSPAQMTSCPSGCDVVGQTASGSQGFTSPPTAATQIPQTSLIGTIKATNTDTTTWSVKGYQFTGGGYACAGLDITLFPGETNSYTCFLALTSPPSIPAGTIQGTVLGIKVTYSQPAALTGDGHYEVLQQDCTAALNTVHSQGTTWAQGWFSGQTLTSGWQWARTQPAINFTGDTCPVNQQQPTPFNFTASTTANVQDSAYNPAAAQGLAGSRLNAALPGGYQWKAGSQTTCSPTVSGVAGNGTVTLSCSDAGTAVFIWSDGQRSQLASDVAGQTRVHALAVCNARTGVRAGSCAVAIQGGDGSVLPANAGAVTVTVGAP